MSAFQAGYAFVALISFVLAIAFFFIDGMLLWSIGFIVLVMMLVLIRIIWNNAVWLENVTRKLGDDHNE
ncbi:MAG: hypothetical protein IIC67_00050 [Thaumarchaeota archaeon]|nr:hypothetical protein [Nitrososphaerota archaeon]